MKRKKYLFSFFCAILGLTAFLCLLYSFLLFKRASQNPPLVLRANMSEKLVTLKGRCSNWWELNSDSYERKTREISFQREGSVHIKCSYPILPGKGMLVEYVNLKLKAEAESRFDRLVQGEISSEEQWEDEYTLDYEFFPTYQVLNLISAYGCDFQGRGIHGCTYYEGKTFWQKEDHITELSLDDLFVKGTGYRQFLLRYCESYFKDSGYGYYSSCKECLSELVENDLDIFVLTDKGVVIVFRAYRVGGWADGPDAVLIPYAKLKKFIDPVGPLQEFF